MASSIFKKVTIMTIVSEAKKAISDMTQKKFAQVVDQALVFDASKPHIMTNDEETFSNIRIRLNATALLLLNNVTKNYNIVQNLLSYTTIEQPMLSIPVFRVDLYKLVDCILPTYISQIEYICSSINIQEKFCDDQSLLSHQVLSEAKEKLDQCSVGLERRFADFDLSDMFLLSFKNKTTVSETVGIAYDQYYNWILSIINNIETYIRRIKNVGLTMQYHLKEMNTITKLIVPLQLTAYSVLENILQSLYIGECDNGTL